MEQEFITLIQKHEPLLMKVCSVYCQEPADREDLYQDIVVQLWKSFPHIREALQSYHLALPDSPEYSHL